MNQAHAVEERVVRIASDRRVALVLAALLARHGRLVTRDRDRILAAAIALQRRLDEATVLAASKDAQIGYLASRVVDLEAVQQRLQAENAALKAERTWTPEPATGPRKGLLRTRRAR